LLLCQGVLCCECVEDDACALAFEAADCFAAAYSERFFALWRASFDARSHKSDKRDFVGAAPYRGGR
jgi:hypothetical protein